MNLCHCNCHLIPFDLDSEALGIERSDLEAAAGLQTSRALYPADLKHQRSHLFRQIRQREPALDCDVSLIEGAFRAILEVLAELRTPRLRR